MDCPPTPPNLTAGLRSPEPSMNTTAKMGEELPRDTASPEPNCTICLGPLTDQSNTDICAHKFCFNCIITWSKVKRECPLCKQKFTTIYHNYTENGSHETYTVPRPAPETPMEHELQGNYFMVVNMPNLDMPILPVPFMRRNLNRHRLPHDSMALSRAIRRRMAIPRPTALSAHNGLPPARGTRSQTRLGEPYPQRQPHENHISSGIDRRRQVYAMNQWALPLADVTGRTRETSLAFYRNNVAQTHRLTAWILRDLSVLLSETQIYEASQRINDMLMQVDLQNPLFSTEVRQFLGDRTRHFMHELISFARSPFDMIGYDRSVSYGNWDPTLEMYHADSGSPRTLEQLNDSDIMEVHVEQSQQQPYPSMRERLNFYRQRDTDRWGRIYARLRSIQDYTARASEMLNPFPMPSPASAFTAFGAPIAAPLPNALAPPSVSVHPIAGPSGLGNRLRMCSPPISITLDSSDDEAPAATATAAAASSSVPSDDEVCVVGEYKPRALRTPELIEIDSDAEERAAVVVDEPQQLAEQYRVEEEELLLDLSFLDERLEVVEQPVQVEPPVAPTLPLPAAPQPEQHSSGSLKRKKCKKERSNDDDKVKRKKHKKHKKHRRCCFNVDSSDEESDPLGYVPPSILPRAFRSGYCSDDEMMVPRVKSSIVKVEQSSEHLAASTSYASV